MRGLLLLWVAGVAAAPTKVVDLRSTPIQTQIAVQTCAGLFNRNDSVAGAAYIIYDDRDKLWFPELEGPLPNFTAVSDFLQDCISTVAKGRVRYNYTSQRSFLPHMLTPAAVLDAVPFEDDHPQGGSLPVVFDAVKEYVRMTNRDATYYNFVHFINQTTTMAKLNPGYDNSKYINPPLKGTLPTHLIDFIIKEKLFTFWMQNSCIPLTVEHFMLEQIVNNNPWPKPIAVYGYDSSWNLFGGDLFEAESTCTKEHQMGQIASDGVSNLAFLSRKPAITEPLEMPPAPTEKYNASRSYVGFVIGDGDNVAILKGSHYDWVKKRTAECTNTTCFPLLWSISPHATHLAPEMVRWFQKRALQTGADHFVLPPSGHLYAYASEMKGDVQDNFVRATEEDCRIYNSTASVAWEWFGTWKHAVDEYFPKYAERDVVKSLYTTNVPYPIPTIEFLKDPYKIVGGKTVVFAPREWRGVHQGCDPKHSSIKDSCKYYLTPKQMADELNNNPKGHVSHIYMTSDGGANPDIFKELVGYLDEHVKVVNHNALADLARQRG